MNSAPLISIIVAVKNSERYLADALTSIHAQTYPHHETIIADAMSRDRSHEIALSFPNVRVVQQAGRGFGDAWNCGIAAAQGEFIAILDSDDRWAPEKLRAQLDLFLQDPALEYSVTRMKFFLEADEIIPAGFDPKLLETDHMGYFPGALLARRELFETVGLFDPALEITTDIEWFKRVHDRNSRLGIVPQVLYYKRVHSTNLSHSQEADLNFNRELVGLLHQSLHRRRKGKVKVNRE